MTLSRGTLEQYGPTSVEQVRQRLKGLLVQQGISARQLAKVTRDDEKNVQRWVSGKTESIPADFIGRCEAFGFASARYLLRGVGPRRPVPGDTSAQVLGEIEALLEGLRPLQSLEGEASPSPEPETPDPDVSPIQSAPGWHDEDYEPVRRYESEDVRLAAGTGTFAEQEPVAGEVKFRTSWLRKRRLKAKDVFLVDVLGDSMERTIFAGDAALVHEIHTSPRSGKIYALQAGDGLLVKRLRKRDHRWWADSDNDKYEPQPLDDRARIMGRVVWWAHTDLG